MLSRLPVERRYGRSCRRRCRRFRRWIWRRCSGRWNGPSWRSGGWRGISTLLPAPLWFLYTDVRKEALLSSQIEGTQSSIQELLLFELPERPGVPTDDVIEVSNYVAALEHGVERLDGGFPLSNRLLREVHGRLMASGRGSKQDPGNFRRSQNWIGGTRPGNAAFVPPPPQEVANCMSDLERFLHASAPGMSTLLRCGATIRVRSGRQ